MHQSGFCAVSPSIPPLSVSQTFPRRCTRVPDGSAREEGRRLAGRRRSRGGAHLESLRRPLLVKRHSSALRPCCSYFFFSPDLQESWLRKEQVPFVPGLPGPLVLPMESEEPLALGHRRDLPDDVGQRQDCRQSPVLLWHPAWAWERQSRTDRGAGGLGRRRACRDVEKVEKKKGKEMASPRRCISPDPLTTIPSRQQTQQPPAQVTTPRSAA